MGPSTGKQVDFKDSSHPEAEFWEAAALITVGKSWFGPALLCLLPKGMNVEVEASPSSPFALTEKDFPPLQHTADH